MATSPVHRLVANAVTIIVLCCWMSQPVRSQGICPDSCLCTGTLTTCDPAANRRAWKYNRTLPSPVASTTTDLIFTGNDLTLIRSEGLRSAVAVRTLLLNNNRLKVLDVTAFQHQTALETLDLSGNNLRTLPLGIFANMSSLRTLNLANNWISTLPAHATDFSIHLFTGLTSMTSLSLHGNNIHCDCTTDWLALFVQTNVSIVQQAASVTCQQPASARGQALATFEQAQPPITFLCAAPSITSSPVASVVNRTQSVSLACSAAGLPFPEVTWYHDNTRVTIDYYRLDIEQDGALIIRNAYHEDQGQYFCNVTNRDGFAASQAASLQVDEITCFDRVRDVNETDLDCGGPLCNPCVLTQSCLLDRDCQGSFVCLGSHVLTSGLPYISDQNSRYRTCAVNEEPGLTLVTRLRASLRGRVNSLESLNGTEALARLAQDVHRELITQLEVPQSHISNVRIAGEARHSRPLFKVRFFMTAGGASSVQTALNRCLHAGSLYATLAYLDNNEVQLVL